MPDAPQPDQIDEAILLRDDTDAGITTVTLNRPAKRNALSDAMLAELKSTLDAINGDPAVRVVILAANGPVFCAGHDLKEMRADPSYDNILRLFTNCSEVMLTLTRMRQPVIARVHATAAAAGCQLVSACDLAVAAEDAKFATPGIVNGLFCSTPMVPLSRTVGRKAAMEMLLTGNLIDAERALRFGLVNRVAPAGQLDEAVMEFAERIAGLSTKSMSMGKAAFYKQIDMDLDEAYAFTSKVMAENMQVHDAREGIDAFLEKRHPEWRDR